MIKVVLDKHELRLEENLGRNFTNFIVIFADPEKTKGELMDEGKGIAKLMNCEFEER